MRLFLVGLLAISSTVCFAQEDDLPDYRNTRESFTKVREKDIRSDLSTFTFQGVDESVGKDPLPSLTPQRFNGSVMKFTGSDATGNPITVTIETGTFDPKKHKLMYYEEKYLLRIDNKPFYGNYRSLPKTTITAVTVIAGKDTIKVPPAAFADLYNPSFVYKDAKGVEKTLCGVYLSTDKRKIYVYMINRAVPDMYEVTWVIQDKAYLKRALDYNLK